MAGIIFSDPLTNLQFGDIVPGELTARSSIEIKNRVPPNTPATALSVVGDDCEGDTTTDSNRTNPDGILSRARSVSSLSIRPLEAGIVSPAYIGTSNITTQSAGDDDLAITPVDECSSYASISLPNVGSDLLTHLKPEVRTKVIAFYDRLR